MQFFSIYFDVRINTSEYIRLKQETVTQEAGSFV